ncbi:MAG: hypothetical protein AB9858_04595 [Acidaminococcaceae bacterium]
MKKISLVLLSLMLLTGICFAKDPEPTQKVVIFYNVPDAILQCQNSNEDIISGKEELEKELVNHYGKRFIVQGIERLTAGATITPSESFKKVKPNQTPFFIKISLDGQGESTATYQNAFGAKTSGVAPAINVHLLEAIPSIEDNTFYFHDYGVISYTAGTFALGMNVYAAQTDPRKNTKNAVRGCFRDACQFNQSINKYANPNAYENEYNRFTGNFKKLTLNETKKDTKLGIRIAKFITWCNSNATHRQYLMPLSNFDNNYTLIINYIDNLIQMHLYEE